MSINTITMLMPGPVMYEDDEKLAETLAGPGISGVDCGINYYNTGACVGSCMVLSNVTSPA